jgi:hypothetical protein
MSLILWKFETEKEFNMFTEPGIILSPSRFRFGAAILVHYRLPQVDNIKANRAVYYSVN